MNNDDQSENILREIFATIRNAPSSGDDDSAMQWVEGGSNRPSIQGLDELARMLDATSTLPVTSEESVPSVQDEDDLFPEHPMEQETPGARLNALGIYATTMINLSVLRARTTDWIGIPGNDELNDAFQKAGAGDMGKQLSAAEKFTDDIAAAIEARIETLQKVQSHLEKVENHLNRGVHINHLSHGFLPISRGISADLHEERRQASYIDGNVIRIDAYPRENLSLAKNS